MKCPLKSNGQSLASLAPNAYHSRLCKVYFFEASHNKFATTMNIALGGFMLNMEQLQSLPTSVGRDAVLETKRLWQIWTMGSLQSHQNAEVIRNYTWESHVIITEKVQEYSFLHTRSKVNGSKRRVHQGERDLLQRRKYQCISFERQCSALWSNHQDS